MNRGLLRYPLGRTMRPGPYGFPLGRLERLKLQTQVEQGSVAAVAGAAANTKTAWATLVSPTSFRSSGFMLGVRDVVAANRDHLLDIAVCDPGLDPTADEIILSNVQFSSTLAFTSYAPTTWVPLPIPAGKRIAYREQVTGGTSDARVQIMLFRGGLADLWECRYSDTYGADTTDSGGTVVDPGGSAGTKGAWVTLTPAGGLRRDMEALLLCVGNRLNGAIGTTYSTLIDIGAGSDPASRIIVPDLRVYAENNDDFYHPTWSFLPVTARAGEALSVRASTSNTDATDRLFDASIVAFG